MDKHLEKEAFVGKYIKGLRNFSKTNTSKFFGRAKKSYEKGGAKGLINHISKYKDPTKSMAFGDAPGRIPTMDIQKGKATVARGVRTSLGNTANFIKEVGKGTSGKGVVGGTAQAVKNTGTAMGRQVKGSLYKEIKDPTIYRKGNKQYVKSKAPWMKDREIVSKTGRNSAVVRKRKALTPLSVAAGESGLAIGGTSYALSDKDQPRSKRLANAATDAALFAVSPPIGIASTFLRSPGKTTQKSKKSKNNKLGDK